MNETNSVAQFVDTQIDNSGGDARAERYKSPLHRNLRGTTLAIDDILTVCQTPEEVIICIDEAIDHLEQARRYAELARDLAGLHLPTAQLLG